MCGRRRCKSAKACDNSAKACDEARRASDQAMVEEIIGGERLAAEFWAGEAKAQRKLKKSPDNL